MGADAVETLALAGDPATVLTEVARDHGADLLMVGKHGLSTLGGRLVGSVPGQVIGKASCDVLIAHTTTDRWYQLVVGNHPQARCPALLIGSISSQVSCKAPTHVLLVH